MTPGTWDFASDSYGKVRHSRKACVFTTLTTSKGDQLVTIAARIPNWADARLMAASKDLYTALKDLVELLPKIGLLPSVDSPIARAYDAAQRALAKVDTA
jgi:hypothetical protein